jgi:DNA-binding SARP family transcriptional activator
MPGVGVTVAASRLQLRLFGCFDVRVEDHSVEIARREQRLLAFLALRGRRSRSYVAGILWPDTPEHRALASLRAAVLHSRKLVGDMLEVGRTTLALAPEVSVDVQDMLHSLGGIGQSPDGDAREALVRLASADLLPGWYDDWVLFEKERLQHIRIRALEALAERELLGGEPELALTASLEAVALEPLRESAHAIAIRAHLRAGNPAAAVREYEGYRRRLQTELAIAPSPELARLVPVAGIPGPRNGSPAPRSRPGV